MATHTYKLAILRYKNAWSLGEAKGHMRIAHQDVASLTAL